MKNLNFSCTACGACCNSNPKFNFIEMMDLSDEFIFQTSHNVFISTNDNLLDKDILEHYRKFNQMIVLPEFNATMFYHIDFIGIKLVNNASSCDKLNNNICSIYGKRPNYCRLMPLSIKEPLSNMKTIQIFKDKTEANFWNCDFSLNAKPLLKNGQLVNIYTQNEYFREILGLQETTDIFINFLNNISEEKKTEHFKFLFENASKNHIVISDVFSVLHAMMDTGLLSEKLLENFIHNQIQLMESYLNKNILHKLKDNLKTHRMLKDLLKRYKSYLQNKPYQQAITGEFSI